ncbi:DGQHR domain-containing protein [Jatrophihabitans telluris]|uniref:DGQHR domain-containing protein n=1 Tax=Jatrophihabitans telluris TaxID=2038343 RepID=A0ABY4QXM7_9ACTN|nr:DGQHR domain-containing protein DpdB [Jatrophihabitans telluris]UQX87645.1 DGQHR domain-containing protein [Jatrophihabitans telluris]
MTTRTKRPTLDRRALRLEQTNGTYLYVFSLTAPEILQLAGISRVSRDEAGELIGYQRPEVRNHVNEIVEYLDSDNVVFPNPIIIALPSTVRFVSSRGTKPNTTDEAACNGTLEIPLPVGNEPQPGWIVDGQQRTLALAKARRQDLPVLVTAFITDDVDVQRDQFMRINNTKPLPRGLVTELLPSITSPLPPRLAASQIPSALCDILNRDESSPFAGLIRRSSTNKTERSQAVITDTSIVKMVKDSLNSSGGCLYPYRNFTTGETDSLSVLRTVTIYWACVRETFPDAWGLPPEKSRLMHGAGIRAMGRLMDKIMSPLNLDDVLTSKVVMAELELVAPCCRWTAGSWDELGRSWDAVENTTRHINELSNYLIRVHTQAKMARR